MFYVHHANMDRDWWSWQQRDLETRAKDISGRLVHVDYTNELAGSATLDTAIHISVTVNVTSTARHVTHIQGRTICYAYD